MRFDMRIFTIFVCLLMLIGCYTNVDEDGDETTEVTDETPEEKPVDASLVPEAGAVGEVLIFTGEPWWISPAAAAAEAKTTQILLQAEGIHTEITESTHYIRQWMLKTIQDSAVDVAIFFGPIPTTIYPARNTAPNGSVIEEWIETPDGNTLLNHADWFGFWADGDVHLVRNDQGVRHEGLLGERNGEGALQNITDLPTITMWGTDTPMTVTPTGVKFTPSLVDFKSDRPFPLDALRDGWYAEAVFASNTGDIHTATRADPVVVRYRDRGRIAICHQTDFSDDPKGKVAAEIILNVLN